MSDIDSAAAAAFRTRLTGSFHGILQWQQLDALWSRVKRGRWYVYQVGEALPDSPLTGDALAARIDALDALLRADHDHDYCGIVYADDVEEPTLVKVYDPNNLGSSCSHGDAPIPPLWLLSSVPPAPIDNPVPAPWNRRRWWQLLSR